MNLPKRIGSASLALTMLLGMATPLVSANEPAVGTWDYETPMPTLTAAQSGAKEAFTYNEYTGKEVDGVKNAAVVGVNREEAATSVVPYHTVDKAIEGARDFKKDLSDYYQLLTGKSNADWKLTVFDNITLAGDVATNFMKPDFATDSAWKTVTLPCSWTMQGFDDPLYVNTRMPWQGDEQSIVTPLIPTIYAPVGFYLKEFTVDESLKDANGRIYISLQGVESAYYLYVNGHEVGYSEDTFRPHDFDITDYLNEDGTNTVAVRVHKFSDGTWMECQDMIYDGGIFRDVYLYAKPLVSIKDYTVVTNLDDNFKNADLELSVDVTNMSTEDAADYAIQVDLVDANGQNLFANGGFQIALDDIDAQGKVTVDASKLVVNPKLWSAETPELYTMVLTLFHKDSGAHMESISQQLGFREIGFTRTEVDEDFNNITKDYETMTINGQPLLLKGANRHDTDPLYGKYVPEETMEEDVKLMKRFNLNAVRTSHYSNDEYFYWLCDTYGLYMMGETNAECHAIIEDFNAAGTHLTEMLLDREHTSLETLKNQTAVIMWSIGNEMGQTISGGDNIFTKAIWHLKDNDPTRPVHSEGQYSGGGTDMDSNMYPTVEQIETKTFVPSNMPYIMCEYLHAMGNSGGSVKEYWDVVRTSENMIGGFIWDWVDQSRATDIPDDADGAWDYYAGETKYTGMYDNGEMAGKYFAFGGDWGDTPNDSNFCANGLISADRDVQPELYEVKYQYQNYWFTATDADVMNREITVYNESNFTNLNEYTLRWELVEDGAVIDSGSLGSVNLAPKATKTLNVPFQLPAELKAGAEYYLNLSVQTKSDNWYSEAGHEVAQEQFFVPAQTPAVAPTAPVSGTITLTGEAEDAVYTITADTFAFTVNKATGAIENYTVGGEVLMEQGPVLDFFRGRTDNDDKAYNVNSAWKAAYTTATHVAHEMVGENLKVTVSLDLNTKIWGATKKLAEETVVYTVDPSGAIRVDVTVNPVTFTNNLVQTNYLNVGTTLTLPNGFDAVTWYGNGDQESYSDRNSSSRVGLYENTVFDFYYPFLRPQDAGNLTGVRWISVEDANAQYGLLVSAQNTVEASALPFTAVELDAALHPYELGDPAENSTYLAVDYGSRGIGSGSCGPHTLPEYQLSTKGTYEYAYTMVPYDTTADVNLMELSKQYRDHRDVAQEQVDAVTAAIDAMDIIFGTRQSDKLDAVEAAYEALTETQKGQVPQASRTKLSGMLADMAELKSDKVYVIQDQSNNSIDAVFDTYTSARTDAAQGTIVRGGMPLTNNLGTDGGNIIDDVINGKEPFTIELMNNTEWSLSRTVFASNGRASLNIKQFSPGHFDISVRMQDGSVVQMVARSTNHIPSIGIWGGLYDSWRQMTLTYDGSEFAFYLDGLPFHTYYVNYETVYSGDNTVGATVPDTTKLGIMPGNNSFWLGYDEDTLYGGPHMTKVLRIYDKALTPQEVLAQKEYTFDNTKTPAIEADDDCVVVWLDTANLTMKTRQTPISFTTEEIMYVGDAAVTLTATGGSTHGEITFISSDPSVLKVEGNTATPVGVGIATISAVKAGDETYAVVYADCDVTVEAVYGITTAEATNGTVTVDAETAPADAEVTVTATADSGYKLDTITVTGDTSDTDITVEDGKFTMPEEDVTVSATFKKKSSGSSGLFKPSNKDEETQPEIDNVKTFDDVTDGDWFKDAVDFVTSRDLFQGVGDGKFAPNDLTTRASLITVIYRYAGATFEGEGDAWYADAVGWAVEMGVSDGTMLNDNITREQLVTMLYRYAQLAEMDTHAEGDYTTYVDGDSVSTWAAEAMTWAVGVGLVKGDDLNQVNPQAPATRAETATMMMRFCQG